MADAADDRAGASSALTRGDLLKRGTAAAFAVSMFGGLTDRALGVRPLQFAHRQLSGQLRIMTWAHFVPAYDTWLDGTYAKQWGEMTMKLAGRIQADPEELGAAANDYLYYSGYVTLAYLWAKSVAAADKSGQSAAFKQAKRDTAAFYFARILPRCLAHQAGIEAGVATLPEIA